MGRTPSLGSWRKMPRRLPPRPGGGLHNAPLLPASKDERPRSSHDHRKLNSAEDLNEPGGRFVPTYPERNTACHHFVRHRAATQLYLDVDLQTRSKMQCAFKLLNLWLLQKQQNMNTAVDAGFLSVFPLALCFLNKSGGFAVESS